MTMCQLQALIGIERLLHWHNMFLELLCKVLAHAAHSPAA